MTLEIYQNFVPLLFFFLAFQTLIVQSQNLKTSPKSDDYLNNLVGVQNDHSSIDIQSVKFYLRRFGYYNLDQNINRTNDYFDDHLQSAIEEYQKFYNINVTGTLDSDTIKQMMMPRCGVADIMHENRYSTKFHNYSSQFISKFSYTKGKWPPSMTNLIYRFETRPANIDSKTLRSVIADSFQKWAKVSHLTFNEAHFSSQRENIKIGFYRGDHGDGDPFDGPGNILAHAFHPTDGTLHFDGDENWSINPNSDQYDLESVSVHEIGHLLGLGHSKDSNSIMYPIVYPGMIKRDLSEDDIKGIRTLYSI